jgi:hypothetical protein
VLLYAGKTPVEFVAVVLVVDGSGLGVAVLVSDAVEVDIEVASVAVDVVSLTYVEFGLA